MSAVMLNGLFVGIVYGLIGTGLVVCYRGSRVVNFAYGETGMVAAFVYADLRFGAMNTTDHGLLPALPLALAVAAALGAATELLVIRPLRDAPRMRPLVGTFAVGALFLIYAVRRWGLNPRPTQSLIGGDGIVVLDLRIVPAQLLIGLVSLTVLVALRILYQRTRFGLQLRATALDPYGAVLVGVNVNTTSMMTWAIAGALAGLSAILIAPLVAFNVAFMTTLSIRGLACALVGGLTNIGGAFGAGVLIGVAEGVVAYKTPVSGVTDIAVALGIVALMTIRPHGLARSAY